MSHPMFNGTLPQDERLRRTLELMGCHTDSEGPNKELAARLLGHAEREAYKALCYVIRHAMTPQALDAMRQAMLSLGDQNGERR